MKHVKGGLGGVVQARRSVFSKHLKYPTAVDDLAQP